MNVGALPLICIYLCIIYIISCLDIGGFKTIYYHMIEKKN